MFIGHFAVGFAAKRIVPKVSLGTLFLSVQFLDLLWPIFLLLGVEHVRIDPGNTIMTPLDFYDYPISHSLFTVIGWSIAFGGIYYFFKHNRKASFVLAFGVLSHWLLDLVVHRPDLPVVPGVGPYLGLGLWNSKWATIAIELSLFAGAIGLYLRSVSFRDRFGQNSLLGLTLFLVFVWVGNFIGPPPPSEMAIAVMANAQWLLVFWAYRIESHTQPRTLLTLTAQKNERAGSSP